MELHQGRTDFPVSGRVIVRGTLFNILQTVFTGVLLVVFVTPLIFDRLGPEGFGLWALFLTLASWFSFLDIGVNLGMARFAGQYAGVSDRDKLEKLFCTFAWLYAAGGIVVAGACVAGAHPLIRLFVGEHSHPLDDRALILVCLFQFAGAGLRSLAAIFAGLQEVERAGKLSLGIGVVQALAVVVWSMNGGGSGILGLAAIHAGAVVLNCILLIVLLPRVAVGGDRFPVTFHPRAFDGGMLRSVIGFSAALYATQILVNVLLSDRLYLGWIRAPLDQVAEYHLGATLIGKAVGFLSALAIAVYPAAAALEARDETDRIHRLAERVFRIYAFLGYFLFAFLFAFAPDILHVWIGRPLPFAADITRILAGWGLTAVLGGLAAVAAGAGMPHIQLRSCLVAVASMCALYPFWIRTHGAMGLAGAVTMSFAVSGFIFLYEFRRRVSPIVARVLIMDGLARPICAAIVSVGPAWLVLATVHPSSRAKLAAALTLAGAASFGLYAAVSKASGFLRDDDVNLVRRR